MVDQDQGNWSQKRLGKDEDLKIDHKGADNASKKAVVTNDLA